MNSFLVKLLIVLGFMIIFAYIGYLLKRLARKFSDSSRAQATTERVENKKDKKEHHLLFGVLELIFDIVDSFLL